MKLLVTGGAGFVCSHLVSRLIEARAGKVKVVDNLWRGTLDNLRDSAGRPLLSFDEDVCVGDLTDYDVAERMTRFADTVYHLADIVGGIQFIFSNQGFVSRRARASISKPLHPKPRLPAHMRLSTSFPATFEQHLLPPRISNRTHALVVHTLFAGVRAQPAN